MGDVKKSILEKRHFFEENYWQTNFDLQKSEKGLV